MGDIIGDAMHKLALITEKQVVDWNAFDSVLMGLEDINVCDEEETILSEFIMDGDFYKRGFVLADAIRHFIACGYDVSANNGLNGGRALLLLCRSSYDHYILEAAKVLMNAGASVNYRTGDDDSNEESECLLESISEKLSGTWVADKDYAWANTLEAYYAMAEANIAGKDYNAIDHYAACVGRPLTAVSAIQEGENRAVQTEGNIAFFAEPLVLWFGDKPLVASCYTDFVVNPVYADDNKNRICDVSGMFSSVIGATLKEVQYMESTICYFEFDNGQRLLFAGRDIGNSKRVGTFEIRAKDNSVDIQSLKIQSICGINGISFASTVTNYEEDTVALFCDDAAYLLYLCLGNEGEYKFEICSCSKGLLKEYARRYPLKNHSQISCIYENENLQAIRIDYPEGHLYMLATEYAIELQLNDRLYDPLAYFSLPRKEGTHMEFWKRKDE